MALNFRIVAPPALTDPGRKRPSNQDSAITMAFEREGEPWSLLIVADGVGGGMHGDIASDLTARTVARIVTSETWDDPGGVLQYGAVKANAEVWKLGGGSANPYNVVATTLVAALVRHTDGAFWTLNIGDSRAYVLSGGELRQVTADHSWIADRLREGEITVEEALTAGNRNVITRAIGAEEEVVPDVEAWGTLDAGETLLLCSDGLHGMLQDETIVAILERETAEEAPAALIAAANDAGGFDNIAVALAAAVGGA